MGETVYSLSTVSSASGIDTLAASPDLLPWLTLSLPPPPELLSPCDPSWSNSGTGVTVRLVRAGLAWRADSEVTTELRREPSTGLRGLVTSIKRAE